MSRVRWYHFYFLLALFDVLVIMLSLGVLQRTRSSVEQLIQAEAGLDERLTWLERARENVIALNFPGNNVFKTEDEEKERRRFRIEKQRMDSTLAAPISSDFDPTHVRTLSESVERMETAAAAIFNRFGEMADERDESRRRQLLADAGRSMAEMDEQQQTALQTLGRLARPLGPERKDLLDVHQLELEYGHRSERLIIAAVIVILVAALFFGRKLQQADRELALQRKRLEEERRERLAAIGELCSSVAHGIRNPLAAIQSSAQLALEHASLDDDTRDKLNDIESEGRRLGDRVTRLLNFARATVDRFEQSELQELVDSAIREVEPESRRLGIQIRRDFADAGIPVEVDRHQLQQVVIELVSNAMEQSSAGDEIRVGCQHANGDGLASVTVRDHGDGVPPAARERVFDLFYTTKPTGTGIGLATVRRIARLHGGDVELISPESGGACFKVTLPVRSARASRRAKHARRIDDGRSSTKA